MELTITPARAPAPHRRFVAVSLSLLLMGGLSACATQPTSPVAQTHANVEAQALPLPPPAPTLLAEGPSMTGIASWYSVGCGGGHRTCTGQRFTGQQMTAASHTIPLGTLVRVARVNDPSRFIIVRVNDYMPRRGRILDLSKAAAQQLGMISAGIARVSVEPVVELADNAP